MVHLPIFVLGLFVTCLTVAAVFLVGIDEASDPVHSQPEDLSEIEKRLVDRADLTEQESAGG